MKVRGRVFQQVVVCVGACYDSQKLRVTREGAWELLWDCFWLGFDRRSLIYHFVTVV